MLLDTPLWNLVQENKAATIRNLLQRFDPSQGSDAPIYTPEGEWSYERFEQYLVREGIPAWPRLESGRLDIDGDAFRLMYHVPGIEGLHAARQPRRDCAGEAAHRRRKRPEPAEPELILHRHRSKRPRKVLYNAHAGMRSFMVAHLPIRFWSASIGAAKKSES